MPLLASDPIRQEQLISRLQTSPRLSPLPLLLLAFGFWPCSPNVQDETCLEGPGGRTWLQESCPPCTALAHLHRSGKMREEAASRRSWNVDLRVASNSVLFGSLVFRDILGERRKHVANIFKRFRVLPSNGRCSARRNDSGLTHSRTNIVSPTQRGRA